MHTLQLSEQEETELRRLKSWTPFRDWHAVKTLAGEFVCVDSKRKATHYAKKHAPAAIYKA